MNLKRVVALFILIVIGGLALTPALVNAGQSTDPKDPTFQIVPDCKPGVFPKDRATGKDPCDFGEFEQLVVNVIRWLIYLMVAIAFVLIGWAGLKLMTSAGNSEALSQAYGMIKIVVIGIAIAGLSYIIIVNIFNVLNVNFSEKIAP